MQHSGLRSEYWDSKFLRISSKSIAEQIVQPEHPMASLHTFMCGCPGSLHELSRGVGLYPWVSSPMLMAGDISEKMGEVERNWYVEITVNFCCENRSETRNDDGFFGLPGKESPTGKHERPLLCCSRWHRYCGCCAKAWSQNFKWHLFLDMRNANRCGVQLNLCF